MEEGQFFTPPPICKKIIEALQPPSHYQVADLTFGTGNFFNYLPIESNLYGCELDTSAANVCRFLYPDAQIVTGDFIYYKSDTKFDLIVGNPPFNLETDIGISQFAYLKKSAELLEYNAILAVIVPLHFLSDEFQDKNKIQWVNEQFNFVAQCKLPANSFHAIIDTKLLILQKKGIQVSTTQFMPGDYTVFDPSILYREKIAGLYEARKADAAKLHLLTVQDSIADSHTQYQIKRRLWHVKENIQLREKYFTKAIGKLHELQVQQRPEKITEKDWERVKLTPERILRWLNEIVRKQNAPKPIKRTQIVKTAYGLANKAYHPTLQKQSWNKTVHDLLQTGERFAHFKKLYSKKQKALDIQNTAFVDCQRVESIDQFLLDFTLQPKAAPGSLFPAIETPSIKLNEMQRHDMGMALQKQYVLLAWEQGGGKSVAGMVWMKYWQGKYRNCFLIAPALAVNTTWTERLELYQLDHIIIEKISDIRKIKTGQIVVISYDRVVNLQRFIKKYIKQCSYKIALLADESDELTNAGSQRSKAALNCFRKAKYKLLTTGTTTRNNINELYTQLELLYNNSTAFTCWAKTLHIPNKEHRIEEIPNPNLGYPFPAFRGATLFKNCFCPQKSTVFGIQKDTQDIYNASVLKDLIAKTIITRKFEEITGERKHTIHTHTAEQSEAERKLYEVLLKEFLTVCYDYYSTTGNARKEAALRLIRQIKALIKATSIPHLMPNYEGNTIPGKYALINKIVKGWADELVTIGTIFKSAAKDYYKYFQEEFPKRKIFYIDGEQPVSKRVTTLEAFKQSKNGILICTQQSLKSSVNIPYCNKCILESLQWNIPKMSQFYFRFIRFDSIKHTEVHFVNYRDTIEMNLLALLMAKEKLNDFIKTTNETSSAAIYDEFGFDLNILDSLIQKNYDEDGHLYLTWGKQYMS